MSEPTENHPEPDAEAEALASNAEAASEGVAPPVAVEGDGEKATQDVADTEAPVSAEDAEGSTDLEEELPLEDPIYIAEARLHDMDAVFAIAESAGVKVARDAVLHNYSLVAKRGDEVLGAALGSFDSETGESVVTIVSPPASEAVEGEEAEGDDLEPVLDTMAHKACKKLRAKHHKICRIKHPQDDDFWRSICFIRPAA